MQPTLDDHYDVVGAGLEEPDRRAMEMLYDGRAAYQWLHTGTLPDDMDPRAYRRENRTDKLITYLGEKHNHRYVSILEHGKPDNVLVDHDDRIQRLAVQNAFRAVLVQGNWRSWPEDATPAEDAAVRGILPGIGPPNQQRYIGVQAIRHPHNRWHAQGCLWRWDDLNAHSPEEQYYTTAITRKVCVWAATALLRLIGHQLER